MGRAAPALLLTFCGALSASGLAWGAAAPSEAALPDSAAVLRVTTRPPGLAVTVDSVEVGPAPVTLRLPPKTVRISAAPADRRRFGSSPVEKIVTLAPGADTLISFDLRPPLVLRTTPEPASAFLTSGVAGESDSLLGETPVSVFPGLIEPAFVRFQRTAFADTTIRGELLAPAAGGAAWVALRQIAPLPAAAAAPAKPVYRKSWFQWSLIGVGAALSVASIVFRNEGDDWYDAYLRSSDPSEIPELYDQAAQYDQMSTISFCVGQVAFLGGLALFISNPSP